jgi:hypothetical protein
MEDCFLNKPLTEYLQFYRLQTIVKGLGLKDIKAYIEVSRVDSRWKALGGAGRGLIVRIPFLRSYQRKDDKA